jgi:hypothetical protein
LKALGFRFRVSSVAGASRVPLSTAPVIATVGTALAGSTLARTTAATGVVLANGAVR